MRDYKDLNDYEIIYMVRENDDDATNLLFDKYKPIVVSMAKEYYKAVKRYGLEYEDLLQEGNCALYKAIKQFSEETNSCFYTYATICINSKFKNLLITNNACKYQALNSSISLYEEYDDKVLIDYLKDDRAIDPNVAIEINELETQLKDILYSMDFEDSIICELKINGFTYNDIAKLLNKTRSNVYKAISQLKKNLKIVVEKYNF